jgi:serine/threonine protein kinase
MFPDRQRSHSHQLSGHFDNYRVPASKVPDAFCVENDTVRESHPRYSSEIAHSDFWHFHHITGALEREQFTGPADVLDSIQASLESRDHTYTLCGTPEYLAPEIIRGEVIYICDGSFVDKWRQTGYPQIMICRCSIISDYISHIYDHSKDVRNMTLPHFFRMVRALLDVDKCLDCAAVTSQVSPDTTPESAGQGPADESSSHSREDPIVE